MRTPWNSPREAPALPDRQRSEIRAEIDFYLESRTQEFIADGLDPEEARRKAEEVFGDVDTIVQECALEQKDQRESRRKIEPMQKLIHDIRYAFRGFARSPGFAAVTVLTLAIGIGANTAIFSVVSGVLLQPLPYDSPNELVAIYTRFTPESGMDFPKYAVGSPEYFDYLDQNETMEKVAAVSTEMVTITEGDGEPEMVTGGLVSSSMFAVLRTPPLIGRTLIAADDGAQPAFVVVLGHGLWQRRFGGDSSVVGRRIGLGMEIAEDPVVVEVVGVMPAGFAFPYPEVDLWAPLPLDRARTWRGGHWFHMIGRLAPGVTYEQADAEVEAMMARWAQVYPEHHVGHGLRMMPLLDDYVADVRSALLLLLGAVGFVLLVACANVANLMLARGEGRRRELAVRTALGAGRLRLTQQLFTESMVLAILGGVLGLAISQLGVGILLSLQQDAVPRTDSIGLDLRVLGFSVATVLVAGLLFGLVPAIHAIRSQTSHAFSDGSRTATAGNDRLRVRGFLVFAETALAVLLVIGAGLMAKSFRHLLREDIGLNTENLLFTQLSLPAADYSGEQAVSFFDQLRETVAALPGVESAVLVSRPPLASDRSQSRFHIDGRPEPTANENGWRASHVTAGSGFFKALGIPLIRGRLLDDRDRVGSVHTAVIDQEMANRYWPGEDPLGQRIRFGRTDGPLHTIVGIVGDVRFDGLHTKYPTYYHPYEQLPGWGEHFALTMDLAVRTTGDPLQLAGPIRQVVREIDSGLPIARMRTMDQVLAASVASQRFMMTLLGLFAFVALLLGAIGIYGVVSHGVAQRTGEIGIRLALGAGAATVVGMVIRQGLILALLGTAGGVVAALAGTRVMASLLHEVSPTDPWIFLAVALAVVVVSLIASYLPAHRASRVDPLEALKVE
jgi:putative ABC transport system permease protein